MDARDFFGYKHRGRGARPPTRGRGRRADGDAPPQFEEAITLDDPAVIARIDAIRHARPRPRAAAPAGAGAPRGGVGRRCDERHRDVDAGAGAGHGRLGHRGGARGRHRPAIGCACRSSCTATTGCRAWVGPRTLVIAASHSGDTVETLSGARRRRDAGPAAGGHHRPAVASAARPIGRRRRSCATSAPGQPRAAIGFGVGLIHELLVAAGPALRSRPARPGRRGAGGAARAQRAGRSRPMPTRPSSWRGRMFGRIPVDLRRAARWPRWRTAGRRR